jgi:hypothetical protein
MPVLDDAPGREWVRLYLPLSFLEDPRLFRARWYWDPFLEDAIGTHTALRCALDLPEPWYDADTDIVSFLGDH